MTQSAPQEKPNRWQARTSQWAAFLGDRNVHQLLGIIRLNDVLESYGLKAKTGV